MYTILTISRLLGRVFVDQPHEVIMDNTLSTLIAQVAIARASVKEVPAHVFHGLYVLERRGIDVMVQLESFEDALLVIDYRECTKLLRAGAVDLASFRKRAIASTVETSDIGTGYRSRHSLVGLYFMQLNRRLTEELVAQVK